MPNKTIYVSGEDLELFQRAQALAGGSLSAAIVAALRRYVDIEEGRAAGFDEIVVKVGPGVGRKVRFSGVLLGEWGAASDQRMEVYRVYRSRTGKFVLHVDRSPDWTSNWTPTDPTGASATTGGWRGLIGMGKNQSWTSFLGLGEQTWGFAEGEATLEVVETVEQLREKIPEELYTLIARAAEHPPVEDLDI
ncbi:MULTISPECIES: EXLDI protein [unclassified Crossiella]|uniref:EXLDI protein n=1 Tax=unclassified Crossiella TaxID=2620835 RepID=UPI001FFF7B95|nr:MULTISPECIES: EXLDI protein [unclassified Crossiella]MCK2238833.1 EXLDI protein [Crossiella sp. S99.2]MCK2251597.1 EXLDI protein [Crossiella sp. S99.1]